MIVTSKNDINRQDRNKDYLKKKISVHIIKPIRSSLRSESKNSTTYAFLKKKKKNRLNNCRIHTSAETQYTD